MYPLQMQEKPWQTTCRREMTVKNSRHIRVSHSNAWTQTTRYDDSRQKSIPLMVLSGQRCHQFGFRTKPYLQYFVFGYVEVRKSP